MLLIFESYLEEEKYFQFLLCNRLNLLFSYFSWNKISCPDNAAWIWPTPSVYFSLVFFLFWLVDSSFNIEQSYLLRISFSMKCPPCNVLSMKCPMYEMSFYEMSSMKCLFYEMSFLWNVFHKMSSIKCLLWNVLNKMSSMKCPQ